jgi:hypothetical protein
LKAARGSSSGSTPGAGAISTVWQGSGRSRSPPKQALRCEPNLGNISGGNHNVRELSRRLWFPHDTLAQIYNRMLFGGSRIFATEMVRGGCLWACVELCTFVLWSGAMGVGLTLYYPSQSRDVILSF